MNKCIVCNQTVNKEELGEIKPVHAECFDLFETADEFLEYQEERSK